MSKVFGYFAAAFLIAAIADLSAPPPFNIITQLREHNHKVACASERAKATMTFCQTPAERIANAKRL